MLDNNKSRRPVAAMISSSVDLGRKVSQSPRSPVNGFGKN